MKKISILILIVLAVIVFAFTILMGKASAEIEAEDVGLLPGMYEVIWMDGLQRDFELMYINDDGSSWHCRTEHKGHCTESDKPAPKIGAIYEKIGNQKWGPVPCPDKNGVNHCDTQEIRWDNLVIQECWLYVPEIEKDTKPVCCSTCQNCYEVGHMSNGKWVKEKDLGCVPFGKDIPTSYLGKPITLYAPQELKSTRVCSDDQPSMHVWLDQYINNGWAWVVDLDSRYTDNSGRVDCNDLKYSTNPWRQSFRYYDDECPCLTDIQLTDPGEKIVPDRGE